MESMGDYLVANRSVVDRSDGADDISELADSDVDFAVDDLAEDIKPYHCNKVFHSLSSVLETTGATG